MRLPAQALLSPLRTGRSMMGNAENPCEAVCPEIPDSGRKKDNNERGGTMKKAFLAILLMTMVLCSAACGEEEVRTLTYAVFPYLLGYGVLSGAH